MQKTTLDLIASVLDYYRAPLRYSIGDISRIIQPELDLFLGILNDAQGDGGKLADIAVQLGTSESELEAALYFYLKQSLFNADNDHYQLLGLTPMAETEEIKSRYRILIRLFHPDKIQQTDDWDDRIATHLNEAYSTLKKPATRSKYDRQLATERQQTRSAQQRPVPPRPAMKPAPDYSSTPVEALLGTGLWQRHPKLMVTGGLLLLATILFYLLFGISESPTLQQGGKASSQVDIKRQEAIAVSDKKILSSLKAVSPEKVVLPADIEIETVEDPELQKDKSRIAQVDRQPPENRITGQVYPEPTGIEEKEVQSGETTPELVQASSVKEGPEVAGPGPEVQPLKEPESEAQQKPLNVERELVDAEEEVAVTSDRRSTPAELVQATPFNDNVKLTESEPEVLPQNEPESEVDQKPLALEKEVVDTVEEVAVVSDNRQDTAEEAVNSAPAMVKPVHKDEQVTSIKQTTVTDKPVEPSSEKAVPIETGSMTKQVAHIKDTVQQPDPGVLEERDNPVTREQSLMLLQAYIKSYEAGDNARMVSLFSPDAVIDRGQGSAVINQHYNAQFRKWSKRQITVHELDADEAPHVSARLEARVLPAGDAHSMVESGGSWQHYLIDIELDLIRMEDQVLIARMTDRVRLK